MSGVAIMSHDDDSVTLTVGTVKARIRGRDWAEANAAARALAASLTLRKGAERLKSKLSYLTKHAESLARLLEDVEKKASLVSLELDESEEGQEG